ncbi:hypothetical protein [uncultured Anaerococcus sp.]|uniref:hypothetical protein n=1 Tax=uncultured Anaerococcus sp. TaxID=293428 RepID=UPI002804E7A0|nr:hypothetical protein [uncultured Anaerococcus sp.]
MNKKNILLSILLIIILGACKIESQKPGEVGLIKEDFDLDLMDKYDGGNIVDFGTGVYSIKGGKDSNLELKLTSFDKGEENKIFDIDLASLEEGEKLGFELSSNQVNVYVISDKKISRVTKFDYENQVFTNGEFKVSQWTEGGLLKDDEPFPVFVAYLVDSNEFSAVGLENPDFYSEIRNKKDLSAMVLEISSVDDE